MSFETAIILSVAILVATLFGLLSVVANRRRKAQEEEMARAASSRGWKFESVMARGYRIHRWTGSTEGVAWTAESLRHVSGGNKRNRRRHIGRWHAAWTAGPEQPMVFMGMPKGAEVPLFQAAQGDGVFAQLAVKAAGYAFDKAVDMYFGEDIGEQVDVTTMRRVKTGMPGYVVMAADANEGERLLARGFERAIVDASNDRSSVMSESDRPWILMRKDTVSLARMERFRNVEEVDAFIRAGLALTRVPKFGGFTAS